MIDGEKLPGAQYFPNARLNFAENLLEAEGDGVALVFGAEDQKVKRTMTRADLKALVSRLQQAFKASGVQPGTGSRA